MPYGNLDDKSLDEEVTLRLRKRDIILMRAGLEELLQTYTRHEHLFDHIHQALARLPKLETQGQPRTPAGAAG